MDWIRIQIGIQPKMLDPDTCYPILVKKNRPFGVFSARYANMDSGHRITTCELYILVRYEPTSLLEERWF
jgi:hypothetical protein